METIPHVVYTPNAHFIQSASAQIQLIWNDLFPLVRSLTRQRYLNVFFHHHYAKRFNRFLIGFPSQKRRWNLLFGLTIPFVNHTMARRWLVDNSLEFLFLWFRILLNDYYLLNIRFSFKFSKKAILITLFLRSLCTLCWISGWRLKYFYDCVKSVLIVIVWLYGKHKLWLLSDW